ncbi:hypothetical protein [Mangrovivirga cuniculi]|uniref:Uncharacterized protein n=1 Tax=Mangrovivirga cuniculi TaxID=2715131 RepID=A0A4D7JKU7_9BACT|nr:hypothetical protein [Mangrovivirga cuniculi]QCK15317.1 hypothetical protein DCC35_11455 [Mangrovivirga cuniculi]
MKRNHNYFIKFITLFSIILSLVFIPGCRSDNVNKSENIEINKPLLRNYSSGDSLTNVAVSKVIQYLKKENLSLDHFYLEGIEDYDSVIYLPLRHTKSYQHAYEMTKDNEKDGWVVYQPLDIEDSYKYERLLYYYHAQDSIYDPIKENFILYNQGRVEGNPDIYIHNKE